MKILKFGGTSVGSIENIQRVANIVLAGTERQLVVLSALSGITNTLVRIAEASKINDIKLAEKEIAAFQIRHTDFVQQLLPESLGNDTLKIIQISVEELNTLVRNNSFNLEIEKKILAQGELLSTQIFCLLLQSRGHNAGLLPALDFMRIDRLGEPDVFFIKAMLTKILEPIDASILVTQGYICRNAFGEVDNLKRGGSDYTATLLGAALEAEIQIWTDIDGMHNNDPRVVEQTKSIKQLSYAEAAELAYFGAKILHPTCVRPAATKQIPIILKNTMDPEAVGTTISSVSSGGEITAIAAKDNITAIKVKSGRMLQAHGFLKETFEIFDKHRTSIDCVTTSEVAVSLTIDDETNLEEIISELRVLGEVEVDRNQSIICIVGNFIAEKMGVAQRIFKAFANIPIRMISYGGSAHNVTILVDQQYKQPALRQLNAALFNFDA